MPRRRGPGMAPPRDDGVSLASDPELFQVVIGVLVGEDAVGTRRQASEDRMHRPVQAGALAAECRQRSPKALDFDVPLTGLPRDQFGRGGDVLRDREEIDDGLLHRWILQRCPLAGSADLTHVEREGVGHMDDHLRAGHPAPLRPAVGSQLLHPGAQLCLRARIPQRLHPDDYSSDERPACARRQTHIP